MTKKDSYHPLTKDQILLLEDQRCTAENWDTVSVSDGFNPARLRDAHFLGRVKIGKLTADVTGITGLEKPAGIYNAAIADCTLGDNVRIANVGVIIANYDIADNVCIENVGTIQTNPAASFGNGVEIDVLNEAGGREVMLFNELNAQFAYILCLHRYRPELTKKLKQIASAYVKKIKSDRGKIGPATCICSTKEIIDVNIGASAKINAASSLINGSILSTEDAPTIVGVDVVAKDFIIAESASVKDGAILHGVFVGQGCLVGKQYSAEASLFFANSEAFHGEACSVFAGPYTVTHHKSSLLIAGLFNFYNAGSGTNQSNHMYKLGPAHEGKLQRGTKTGSFSYMMWPCRVGPFSVVLGKHSGTFDTADYPFSHLEATPSGKCHMVPGLHLTTVGTVRDGAKWPARDRRKGKVKRDAISFAVFSPYTVGKMIKANAELKDLQQKTDKSIEQVSVGGAMVKRPILRTGQKHYRTGIGMYLLEKIAEKIENALEQNIAIKDAFPVDAGAVYSQTWPDIAGLLMPTDRLKSLESDIEAGKIATVEAFTAEIEKIDKAYHADEWIWVKNNYENLFDLDLDKATEQEILNICREYLKVKTKFLRLVAADAGKEFDELSHRGFGQDGSEEDIEKDFTQVRGLYDRNKFVKDISDQIAAIKLRVKKIEEKIKSL